MKPWFISTGRNGHYNIVFSESFPMRGNGFPKQHPCADDPRPMVAGAHRMKPAGSAEWIDVPGEQPESDTALGRLRAMGYWCSCFPEGDGITVEALKGQTAEQLAEAVRACFNRPVNVLRLN